MEEQRLVRFSLAWNKAESHCCFQFAQVIAHKMSFGDISASRGTQRGFGDVNNGDKDTIAILRNALAQFQVIMRCLVALNISLSSA